MRKTMPKNPSLDPSPVLEELFPTSRSQPWSRPADAKLFRKFWHAFELRIEATTKWTWDEASMAESWTELEGALNQSTTQGVMVDFSDERGRAAYAAKNLRKRSGYTAMTLALCGSMAAEGASSTNGAALEGNFGLGYLREAFQGSGEVSVLSVGGGPAYDAIGISAYLAFTAAGEAAEASGTEEMPNPEPSNGDHSDTASPLSSPIVRVCVADLEEGWRALVEEAEKSIHAIGNELLVAANNIAASGSATGNEADSALGGDSTAPAQHSNADFRLSQMRVAALRAAARVLLEFRLEFALCDVRCSVLDPANSEVAARHFAPGLDARSGCASAQDVTYPRNARSASGAADDGGVKPRTTTNGGKKYGFDVIIFPFVVVENAIAMRRSKFEFITSLLLPPRTSGAGEGVTGFGASYLFFMDSTHRLWGEISDAAMATAGS